MIVGLKYRPGDYEVHISKMKQLSYMQNVNKGIALGILSSVAREDLDLSVEHMGADKITE